jgi:hypothetical protein
VREGGRETGMTDPRRFGVGNPIPAPLPFLSIFHPGGRPAPILHVSGPCACDITTPARFEPATGLVLHIQ